MRLWNKSSRNRPAPHASEILMGGSDERTLDLISCCPPTRARTAVDSTAQQPRLQFGGMTPISSRNACRLACRSGRRACFARGECAALVTEKTDSISSWVCRVLIAIEGRAEADCCCAGRLRQLLACPTRGDHQVACDCTARDGADTSASPAPAQHLGSSLACQSGFSRRNSSLCTPNNQLDRMITSRNGLGRYSSSAALNAPKPRSSRMEYAVMI